MGRTATLILMLWLASCGGVDPAPKLYWDDCVACHRFDFDAATDPKHEGVYPQRCSVCHGRQAWRPRQTGDRHEGLFPILDGKHGRLGCEQCHPQPAGYLSFSCLTCKEHGRSKMDRKHDGEAGGYRYQSTACKACHPRGKE